MSRYEPSLFDIDAPDALARGEAQTGGPARFYHEEPPFPAFSILDSRRGEWQDRKRAWLALGIESEIGRDRGLTMSDSLIAVDIRNRFQKSYGRLPNKEELAALIEAAPLKTTSVFDPVLTELAYRWFCPSGGRVLDPFAGGSVRGLVGAALGYRYTGVELRGEQVAANREQARTIAEMGTALPGSTRWIEGDSAELPGMDPGDGDAGFDMILSCPPYADLEVYSDDPRDLSTMEYADFLAQYRRIVAASVARLKTDRFAFWVVGEVRGPQGMYRGFVPDTVRAFEDAGARFYNDAVLVNVSGSAGIRQARTFGPMRKLVKTHQVVRVYVVGDPRKATDAIKASMEPGHRTR